MQLADDDAFSTVDDEFAAADHDRHVAKIDFFFDRLLFHESQPDSERSAKSQAELATLQLGIAWFSKFVFNVFEAIFAVVAFDRKDFSQDRFESFVFSLAGIRF